MRILVGILVALGLAGCRFDEPRPSWLDDCTVQGIDVSRHQGDIDWAAVAESGVKFAWIKATEGGDHADAKFQRNWVLARDSGLKRGAYHFVYWCRAAADQAAWFAANVADDPEALPPILDVEWNPNSKTCPNRVERDTGVAAVKAMLEQMERTYGRKPILYAPADIYRDMLDDHAFEDYRLWVRSIGTVPARSYGARPWVIWQYSDTGRVPGIKGDVDLNCVQKAAAAGL